ncbi:DUF5590 domain-containing protein [Lentilactobacillus senioris]|uniref:cell wall elongation regulator TseB-like domain-containing protein n=1 Tax=Lentilactobacillus senioris TaxID=931534 RepID=UPI00227F8089|nr:DUF5590 domain-containing protein [Lentilactobacillus senioris]MCY9806845.1 DUF5590 domain-containing protein [Lentilactobacillus senioris]
MQRQRQTRIKRGSRVPLIITGVILIIIFASVVVLTTATRPMRTAKAQTVAIAKKYGKVTKTTNFYSSNLGQTYYSVAGNTDQGKKVYVIVAKKGGHVTVLNQSAGISEASITQKVTQTRKPSKILNVSLTLTKEKPYWSVSYLNQKKQLCYAIYQFKNGKLSKLITNV